MKSIFYSFLFACFFGVKCVFAQQLSPMIGFDLSELTETRDGIKKGESLLIKSYNDLTIHSFWNFVKSVHLTF